MSGSKKKKPLAETTVAHHHAMLKTACNWALEEELLLVNPALRVKNPPALRPKTRPVWSMEEIASTVIKARGLQVHAAGVLAGFSGLRVGEISGLLWSDLDLERGFVTVSRTVEEDDDGTLLQYPPKNGKARVVPLPAAACDELRVWLAAQKEYRLAQGPAWNEAGRVVPKKGNFLATCRRRSAAPLARLCSPLWPKDSRSQRTAHELRGLLSEATDRQRRMLRQGWPSATTPLTTHSTWAGSRARVSTST